MRPDERRAGENEVLYREVNERVRELNDSFDFAGERVDFVCECERLDCADRVSMTVAEYERIRDDPRRFLVLTGHQNLDVERVLEEHGGYTVVEKREGEPARLAEEEDPR